jgi:phosphatidate cytidylyltransferase
VIICGLLLLLHLDFHHPLGAPGVWLIPLVLLATILTVHELLDLWSERTDRPVAWPLYIGAPAVVSCACVPLLWSLTRQPYPSHCLFGQIGWQLAGFVLAVGLSFVGEIVRYDKSRRSTGGIALSIMAVTYGGLFMSFLVSLRLVRGSQWGMVAVISLIVIVKLSDTGAYFTGRLLGKHKLAPRLSPGKTVEGSIGGLVSGCVGAWICHSLIAPQLVGTADTGGPLWCWLLYGLVVTTAGMLGDLAESLMKRDADRKDSSTWLPGLGGVLDILDSLLFAAPTAYLLWASGLIGPTTM